MVINQAHGAQTNYYQRKKEEFLLIYLRSLLNYQLFGLNIWSNKMNENRKILSETTNTHPLPNSRKIYVSGKNFSGIRVPMREISLTDGTLFTVYDTSGSHTDRSLLSALTTMRLIIRMIITKATAVVRLFENRPDFRNTHRYIIRRMFLSKSAGCGFVCSC